MNQLGFGADRSQLSSVGLAAAFFMTLFHSEKSGEGLWHECLSVSIDSAFG